MRLGIASLIAAYVFSQFYRAFLAVMTPVLKAEIGVTAEELALASGLWFLTFAAMQIPVGMALDSIGPRRTVVTLFAIGGAGGAALFAFAQSGLQIQIAMALIGIGCAPVLMASYYIFARSFSPARFGVLAGMVVGIGSLGNIAGSAPLAWMIAAVGWRQTLWGLIALTLLIALLMALCIKDPEKVTNTAKGSVLDLLKIPALWPILVMMTVCYMPGAGLRGLWVGPYYADVFGADAQGIGRATLVMGLAMVLGTFAYGPLERVLGSRKWLIFGGNMISAAGLWVLFAQPDLGGWQGLLVLAMIGFAGSSFPMVIAHGRAFIPAHLTGRGVTLLNLFGIGSAGIAQVLTGKLHGAVATPPPEAPYQALFLFYAATITLGCLIYLTSRDKAD